MPVRQVPGLFKECRGKATRESGVVNRLYQHVVKDLGIKPSRETQDTKVPREYGSRSTVAGISQGRLTDKQKGKLTMFSNTADLPSRYGVSAWRNPLDLCPFSLKNDEA